MKSIRLKEKAITAKNARENLALTDQKDHNRRSSSQTKQKKAKVIKSTLGKDKTKNFKNVDEHTATLTSDMELEMSTKFQDEDFTSHEVQGHI